MKIIQKDKIKIALRRFPRLYRFAGRAWMFCRRIFGRVVPQPVYSDAELAAQRATSFAASYKISILVPLYNTPIRFLRAMIRSVQAQTYQNWELCLADGSDKKHRRVERRVRRWAQSDARILYRKLEKNGGISENTNACIDMASGDYIALFDHDDLLHPAALWEVMSVLCTQNADFVYTDEAIFRSPRVKHILAIHYKPDYSPDTLRGINYICHLSVFSRTLLDRVGHFDPAYDGAQDHDLILRLTEQAQKIVHIPKVLYYWRSHRKSTASGADKKNYAIQAGQNAVLAAVRRGGMDATVESACSELPTLFRIRYKLQTDALVSIIIPTKNHCADLRKCINSILEKTTYQNYEILIVDNGSDEAELFAYYESLKAHTNIRVLPYDIPFNYSRINNYAAKQAKGDYLLLLNNDIEIITPDWLTEMLMYAQRPDVGAVGAMLYYPDDTVQHGGVIIGLGGVAGHAHKHFDRNSFGYMGRMLIAQNLSAVTAACILVKTSVFWEVGGLEEEAFAVAFNDVDLCLKIRAAGHLIVHTPHAQAYHYESKSRGYEDTPEKIVRFQGEIARFQKKWKTILEEGDPYYNPHLTVDREDFGFR